MRLSVLNTRLPFLRSTDAKTEVTGDRLSSTVVSILPLILSPCHLSHFSFECLLSFWLSYTRTCTYIFILSRTRSPILLRLRSTCSLARLLFRALVLVSRSFARFYTFLCLFILDARAISFGRFFRRGSWYCRNQTFVPSGTHPRILQT